MSSLPEQGLAQAGDVLDAFVDTAVSHITPCTGGGVVDQLGTRLHLPLVTVNRQKPVFVFVAVKFNPLADRQHLLNGVAPMVGEHPNGGIAFRLHQGGSVKQHGVTVNVAKVSPASLHIGQPCAQANTQTPSAKRRGHSMGRHG